ncbi:MAG: hypothetical protein ACOC9Z_04280 [Chloroflexota bacterium]
MAMVPLQAHEIRAMRKAQALREAQQAQMATAVRARRSSLPARLARFAMPGKTPYKSTQSHAPTPC